MIFERTMLIFIMTYGIYRIEEGFVEQGFLLVGIMAIVLILSFIFNRDGTKKLKGEKG